MDIMKMVQEKGHFYPPWVELTKIRPPSEGIIACRLCWQIRPPDGQAKFCPGYVKVRAAKIWNSERK